MSAVARSPVRATEPTETEQLAWIMCLALKTWHLKQINRANQPKLSNLCGLCAWHFEQDSCLPKLCAWHLKQVSSLPGVT
jgi:hypothetical protein